MGAIADTADQAKRDALAAGATAGSAGVAAYKNAAQSIEAQRAAAVQALHQQSASTGVNAGGQATLDALINRPAQGAAMSLTSGQAAFEADRARADAANSAYFDKVKSVEPIILANNAATAAARAGSGGGGGGGGNPGDLTDAQLGKFLMNKAAGSRDEALRGAQSDLEALVAQRRAAAHDTKASKRKLKRRGHLGDVALQHGPDAIDKRIAHQQARIAALRGETDSTGARPDSVTSDIHRRRDRVKLLDRVAEQGRRFAESKALGKTLNPQIAAADSAYAQLDPSTGGRPLTEDARAIAEQMGVDPTLTDALLGPTVEAQYQRALQYGAKSRAPDVYVDAAALRVTPTKIRHLTNSTMWGSVDAIAQQLAAGGATWEEYQAELRATASDPKVLKKFKVTHDDVQTAIRLAQRRYRYLFPTINEVQNQQNYQQGF